MRNHPLESIKKTADFKIVYKLGKAFSNKYFVMYVYPNDKSFARLGLSINKKIGKAILRNKIRRRIKEFFRLNKHSLVPADYVVVARISAAKLAAERKYSDVAKSLALLLEQL